MTLFESQRIVTAARLGLATPERATVCPGCGEDVTSANVTPVEAIRAAFDRHDMDPPCDWCDVDYRLCAYEPCSKPIHKDDGYMVVNSETCSGTCRDELKDAH